jgi:hypothetical protein
MEKLAIDFSNIAFLLIANDAAPLWLLSRASVALKQNNLSAVL